MELILVYNADSGLFNAIRDGVHKFIAPNTYQCNLCALTFGTITMKEEWKTFIESLGIPADFLHRDEFLQMLKSHPHNVKKIQFPAIFLEKDDQISLFIPDVEINKCKTLKDLMDLITRKITSIGKH